MTQHEVDQSKKPLLDVKGLKTYFYTEDGVVQAVNGVDFAIRPGEIMGLVGESAAEKVSPRFRLCGC